MESAAVNEYYLQNMTEKQKEELNRGLRDQRRKELHRSYQLFRFASFDYQQDWLANPWWTGFSSHQSLTGLAAVSDESLSQIARAALAVFIDPAKGHFNKMDVLLCVRISRPLAGVTGTPNRVSRVDKRPIGRWEPDRSMAQFYIPGLDQLSPPALTLVEHKQILGNSWTPS